jgi:hypothetical protein
MPSKFVIMKSGELHTYTEYDEIPTEFEHVIEFSPEIPPPPHSDEEHEILEQWHHKFLKLMEIEYASSGKIR